MTIEADATVIIPGRMVAGQEFQVAFRVAEDTVAVPLDGYQAFVQLRTAAMAGTLLDSWIDGDAELTRDDAAGTVTLFIPASQTRLYTFSTGYIDLLLVSSTVGIRSAVVEVELYRGVTR